MATGTINSGAEVNLPPDILGESIINIDNRATYIFRIEDFTTGTTPAYSDPNGDPADAIKVVSQVLTGPDRFKLAGVPIVLPKIITKIDIDSALFSYTAPDQDPINSDSLEFTARDTGSGQFSDPIAPSLGSIIMNSAIYTAGFTFVKATYKLVNTDPNTCAAVMLVGLFIPSTETWFTATVIWLNADGTGVPDSGFYTNSGIMYQWDGMTLTLVTEIPCTIVGGFFANLNFDVDLATLCATTSLPGADVYMDTASFATATTFSTDSAQTIDSPYGYYLGLANENGDRFWKFWDGTPMGGVSICI